VLVLIVVARSAEGVEEQVLSIVHSMNLEKKRCDYLFS
jgi:hypothetical protein